MSCSAGIQKTAHVDIESFKCKSVSLRYKGFDDWHMFDKGFVWLPNRVFPNNV